MILWLLLVVLVLWAALFRFRKRRMYELMWKIPRPKDELPIIGIAHKISGSTEDIMSFLKNLSYESMKGKGILRTRLLHILYLLVVDPVDVEMVLKTSLEKSDIHNFMRDLIGFGVVFAPVAIWRRRRKLLIPALSPKIVESFVEVFSEKIEMTTNYLANMCGSEAFDIWPFITAFTMDCVCETSLGINVKAQSNPKSEFLKSISSANKIVVERICHVWLHPEWLFKLFPQHDIFCKDTKILNNFVDEVIRTKRIDFKNKQSMQSQAEKCYGINKYGRQSFLDFLIRYSDGDQGYTDLELRQEALTLIAAGSDTAATSISFTLRLLGKYPQIQEKVYEEVYELFGDSDRPVVSEDLPKLEYLERVIKETLRLFPSVPFVIRKLDSEITLPSGTTIPAESCAIASIFGLHRDPKYWGADAEHFDPDRFLPERLNLQHACSYMPFSNGPRNCVGYKYAMMLNKTALAAIIRSFEVICEPEKGPIPDIQVKLEIMMKAVDGHKLVLKKRNRCPVIKSKSVTK